MTEVIELESIPTKIKYKGIVWIPEQTYDQTDQCNNRPSKQNYFVKWLLKNKKVGDIVILADFYKEYPNHERDSLCRHRLKKVLSSMIQDKQLQQHGNNEFKVLKL